MPRHARRTAALIRLRNAGAVANAAAAGMLAAAAGGLLAACGGSAAARSNAATPSTGAPTPAAAQPFAVTVAPQQLSVAEELGPDIVAVGVAVEGARLALQVHTLTGLELPAAIPISLPGATIAGSCGLGCYRTSVAARTRTLLVTADIHGTTYTATLPIEFSPDGAAVAQTLLTRLDAGQVELRSAAVFQSLRSSPSEVEITHFQIQAPDRFAYQVALNGRPLNDTTIIGKTEWGRAAGKQHWQPSSYGSQAFSAAGYLDWWNGSTGSPRLLDRYRTHSTQIADVATVTRIPDLGPVWMRFHIDVTHERLLTLRMITVEHFMTQIWSSFNAAPRIEGPTDAASTSTG